MMPIVNGLEAEFDSEVAFIYMNAADETEGQRAFESLNLPGHPSYVVFAPAGEELYRSFGIVSERSLRGAIESALSNPMNTDEP
jgi:hypothetical protein